MICFILLFIGGSVNISLPTFLLRNCNPRSPWGERQVGGFSVHDFTQISIHAPREGSDQKMNALIALEIIFQSTLPVRGATPIDYSTRAKHN